MKRCSSVSRYHLFIQEAVKHRVHTQEDALKYLGDRIRNPFKEERPVQKSVVDDARNVLARKPL